MRKRLVIIVVLVLLCGLGILLYEFFVPGRSGGEVVVEIPERATFDQIVQRLDDADLIGSPAAFRLLAATTGNDVRIKPGLYRFPRGIPAAELLNALVEGRSTVRVKVTFPEGATIERVASIAAGRAGVDSAELVELATDRSFLRSIDVDAATAEGYLMPDTYYLYWGERPQTLLSKMAELHRKFYTDALKARSRAIGLTPYQVLILASIVEGEARVAEERPVVAGVYLNRLKKGMKLQADPTLQYALPGAPRRLLNSDLQLDSPYNTYRYPGLPPTPINNPGRASIKAVLESERHDYLYFVARADGSGRHIFSRNGAEHSKAVRDYRQRVARQREKMKAN